MRYTHTHPDTHAHRCAVCGGVTKEWSARAFGACIQTYTIKQCALGTSTIKSCGNLSARIVYLFALRCASIGGLAIRARSKVVPIPVPDRNLCPAPGGDTFAMTTR